LITRLRWCVYAQIVTIAVLALWAIVSAAAPAAASAKATTLANDPQVTGRAAGAADRVVVAPGDSLWSISSHWLGSQATTEQIADGVKRIYALNHYQIGSNPNLITAGQRLLVPPNVASHVASEVEWQSPEPARAAPPAQHPSSPTASSPPLRAAYNGSDTAAGAAVGEAEHKPKEASDVRSQPTSLPELAHVAPVAAVGSLAPNDSSPSLAQSFTSKARSVFSTIVATAGEAFSLGSYSRRELLGGALIAMSTVLAFILVLHVAREVWGPQYARRRARERWMREVFGKNYAAPGTFDSRYAYAAASVALDGHSSEGSSKKAADPTSIAQRPRTRIPVGNSENGGASANDVRKIARGRQVRMRQTRPLKAKRPPRDHRKGAAGGALRPGQARRRSISPTQRSRALRREGGRIVGTEPRVPDPTQEWKIGEPLANAMESIPVQPGAPLHDALLEVRPLAANALRSVAFLERHRSLSDKERRQAHALQGFLATIEEVSNESSIG
jgi:LysM domain